MATKKNNVENLDEQVQDEVLMGAPAETENPEGEMLFGEGEEPAQDPTPTQEGGGSNEQGGGSNEQGGGSNEQGSDSEEGSDDDEEQADGTPAVSKDYSVMKGEADADEFNPGIAEGKGMQLTTTLGDGVPEGAKRRPTLDKFVSGEEGGANSKAEEFAAAAVRGKGMSISTGIVGAKNADSSKGPVGAVMPLGDATSYRALCHVNTPAE